MDSSGFEKMVRENQGMVFCVALSYCRDHAAAEDVAQEAFLKAFQSIGELKELSRLKAWLCSIARFTAIDWVRKNPRRNAGLPPDTPTPDESAPIADADRRKGVLEILQSLKSDYREIMMLRYVKGMSYAEIAKVTGATTSAVGEKLHRVRELVRARAKAEVRP